MAPWAVLVVAVAAVAGCSSGHHVAKTTTTAVTSASPNPDIVPATITPAYVNAVFAVLEHIDGNASRALIAAHAVTPEVLADIRAIYNDPLYEQEVKIAEESLTMDMSKIRHPTGDVRVSVVHLLSASPSCLFVETKSDYAEVVDDPPPSPASDYWVLRPKQNGADPEHLNPTPWALAFNRAFVTPTGIPNQCK